MRGSFEPYTAQYMHVKTSNDIVAQLDNGEIEVFNAYRVQHNNSRGPYKGGLRYHPQVDIDDVRR